MKRSLSAACVALLAGCNGFDGLCTLVGCDSGLLVRLAQTPAEPYVIQVWTSGGNETQVFECANPATCGDAFFADYTPKSVTIRVITDAGSIHQETAQPTYSVNQPNGPHCEPTCRNAVVTVPLPG